MKENSPNWPISDWYKKSWQIVKHNKILWLFGMAAAVANSGTSSSFRSNNFDSFQKFFEKNETTHTTVKISQVLGDSTNPFMELVKHTFLSVPTWIYGLLILGIAVLALISVVLGFIYSAWSEAAVIAGTQSDKEEKKLDISEISHLAFPTIRGLIWLKIVPFLVVFGITVSIIFVAGILTTVLPSSLSFIPIIIGIITITAGFIIFILMSLAQIWAVRGVVLDKKPAQKTFVDSFNLARNTFWKMVKLGLSNTLVSLSITIGLILPLAISGGVLYFTYKASPDYLIPIIIFVGLSLLLIIIIGSSIVNGIFYSFKASVWNFAYYHIKKNHD